MVLSTKLQQYDVADILHARIDEISSIIMVLLEFIIIVRVCFIPSTLNLDAIGNPGRKER